MERIQKMNIAKKLLLGGICIFCFYDLGAGEIPPSRIAVPAGSSRIRASEYIVRVPKRNQIANTTPGLFFKPDLRKIAGKAIVFSAEMRCTDIASDAKGNHIGGKILVSYKDVSGRPYYLSSRSITGTSVEWKNCSIRLNVPNDAKELCVVFGIQQGWGTLEIRNPRMDFIAFGLDDGAAKATIPLDRILPGQYCKIKGNILSVTIPKRIPMPNETLGGFLALDLKNMRDKVIKVSGKLRYDVASDVTGYHIGAKVLSTSYDQNSGGKPSWFDSTPLVGKSEEWKDFAAYIPIYATTTSVDLIFGMQQSWGNAEFRDLTLEAVAPIDGTPGYMIPDHFKCEYSPEVLAAAPRRGFMTPVPGRITADDVREMGKWNANLIRYQMVDGIGVPENIQEYRKWLKNCLDKLDSLMPVLKENSIKVVIDMHQSIGGRYQQGKRPPQTEEAKLVRKLSGPGAHRLLCEADMRQAFIDAWKMIARRYKDNPQIFGYDLINEPTVIGPTPYHWADVQYDAAKAIREIDPETPIMIEGNRAASAIFFNVRPIPLKNIFYEIHMYYPGDYCFQGVYDKAYAQHYPQRAKPYTLNKEALRAAMIRVIEFQKKYGAKIYVGEFTVTRWVPDGGGKYLDDLISLFEEYGWDWTFHAFREWDGFSPEHIGTPLQPKLGDNERKAILLKYFKRNLSGR